MASVGPWLQVAVLAVAAAGHAGVGYVLSQRVVRPEMRPGHQAFVVWWGSMAAGIAALGLMLALALSDRAPLGVQLALIETFVLANSVAAAALLGHLTFLWTGSARLMQLMWLVLVGSAFSFTTALFTLDIHSIRMVGDDLVLEMGTATLPGALTWTMGLFFIPQIMGAVSYLALMLRAPDNGSRDRAALVGTSILLMGFAPVFVMLADEMGREDIALFVYILILMGPVLAQLAYSPPAWVRRRWTAEAGSDP